MFIIRTLIITVYYIILTTNMATNKVSCLLYLGHNANKTHNVCTWYNLIMAAIEG